MYRRINWENYSSTMTPLNADNLNRMDSALAKHDEDIEVMSNVKADRVLLNGMVTAVYYNTTSGIFRFERYGEAPVEVDLNIEKIPVQFSMSEDGIIKMITTDGTEYTADVKSLIPEIETTSEHEIDLVHTQEGGTITLSASIKNNSITDDKLESHFLENCRLYSSDASKSSASASISEVNSRASEESAKHWAEQSELWAKTVEPITINVEPIVTEGTHIADITINGNKTELYAESGGSSDYSELENKPQIGGITLVGNKTLDELGIASKSSVDSLAELVGNVNAMLEEV